MVDMSDPAHPQIMSVLALSAIPTDVLLKDSTALIGTAENKVLLVNLNDPANPVNAGSIQAAEFGDHLALSPDGFLLSTSFDSSRGGLQVATFKPLISIRLGAPLLTMLTTNTLTGQPAYKILQDVPVTFKVVPSITASNGTYQLGGTCPTIAGALSFQGQPIADTATITIPAGTLVCGTILTISASADTDVGLLTGLRKISVAAVSLTLDSNNDTVIDDKDVTAKANSSKFTFWEADSNRSVQTLVNKPPADGAEPGAGLLDYSTLRLTLSNAWPSGSLQLRMKGSQPAQWAIVQKFGTGNAYLTSQSVFQQEIANIIATNACGASVTGPLIGECPSDQTGAIILPVLSAGTTEYLFRCTNCPTDPQRQIEVDYLPPGSGPVPLDSALVDISPLKDLMGVYSVRPGVPGTFDPVANAYPLLGWAGVPDDTTNLLLLVHGFAVDEDEATSLFFPAWFKRLYWAGRKVLPGQGTASGIHPFVVGFSWPGDQSEGALGSLSQAITTPISFPPDEYHALQSGIPLARFLANQGNAGNRTIDLMAHSLGNMVVNSALSRNGKELSPNAVRNYVMNEAALPSEVFNNNYAYQASDQVFALKVIAYGYTPPVLDATWIADWALPTTQAQWSLNMATPTIQFLKPQPQYQLRWGQVRPVTGIEDVASNPNTPARGPWQGIFAANPSAAKITNTFSGVDHVLNEAWLGNQFVFKPFILKPGADLTFLNNSISFGDNSVVQYWALLSQTLPEVDGRLWPGTNLTHQNLIRQWEEVSFWFPTRSLAAGNQGGLSSGIIDVDFTSYDSGFGITDLTPTHSYMKLKPYWQVFQAWKTAAGQLQ